MTSGNPPPRTLFWTAFCANKTENAQIAPGWRGCSLETGLKLALAELEKENGRLKVILY